MAQEGNPSAGKAPAAGAEGQGQQAIEPPRSGLVPRRDEGKDTTDIVYPSRREVVEDTIKEAEDASFTTRDLNRLKRLELTRDRAKASPYITPAKPVTRTIPVNLDPGVQPRVIRLSRGLLTSIVFSDRAGTRGRSSVSGRTGRSSTMAMRASSRMRGIAPMAMC